MPAVRLDGAVLALCAAVLLLTVVALRLRTTLWRERRQHLETARKLDDTWHLEELAAELSRVTTGREALHAGLTELLHWLHCAAGAVVLATGDTSSLAPDGAGLTIAHAIGYGGDVPLRAAMSAHAAAMITRAMREQDTLFAAAQPMPAGALPDLLQGCASAIIIPLTLGHRTAGAVVLCFDTAREFDDPERHTLDAAGRLMAQALARASGYDRAEHARAEGEAFRIQAAAELRERQKAEDALVESEARYRLLATRTTRLYAFSAGLSEAITTQDVAKVIVRHGNVVAGASAGSVVLLVDDGTHFETLHAEGYAPNLIEQAQRFAREPGLCTTAAANTRAAVYVSSFADWQRRFPRSATLAADGGFASTAALPLLAKGAVMGVLSFHFTAPVNFGVEYRALLESVSQHCAQALDRARLYEATERARADAEAANRSKDEFLSTVSHELRTPLNAMLGWASMLRNGALDERRAARALEAIYTNATRQAHLIEELLDVSRIVAGRASIDLHEFDLAEHLRGVVEAIMPMAEGKGLELQLEPVPSILVVADPRRLEQVFLNLLTNAVKFTRAGGHITVAAEAADSSVDVRVSDNGDGIDPAFLPHVFERFRQGDSTRTRRVGGLGLGLFIARHLVEAQGGSIRVHSDGPGRGSTFTVTLPAASAAVQPPPPHNNAGANYDVPQPPLHGVRVLIVDDEPDAREMMAAALEVRGAMVASASSAREALDLLTGSAFDVLLSDIAMPGQDGYALIESVRGSANARVARIPAAAVTACTSDDERERALATGFQSYVTKPVQPADLTQTVAALAGGAAPLSPFSAASL